MLFGPDGWVLFQKPIFSFFVYFFIWWLGVLTLGIKAYLKSKADLNSFSYMIILILNAYNDLPKVLNICIFYLLFLHVRLKFVKINSCLEAIFTYFPNFTIFSSIIRVWQFSIYPKNPIEPDTTDTKKENEQQKTLNL